MTNVRKLSLDRYVALRVPSRITLRNNKISSLLKRNKKLTTKLPLDVAPNSLSEAKAAPETYLEEGWEATQVAA